MAGTLSARVHGDHKQIIGPATVAQNPSADITIPFATPNSPGGVQIIGANLYIATTVATQGTNYLTVKIVKIASNGSGAVTVICSYTTNSSGGAAITASAKNAMTLAAAAVADARVASTDLLAILLDYATTTHVALDQLVVELLMTPGATGDLS